MPAVSSISPRAGLPAGGTTVTITGSNFIAASAVYFGSSPASSFTVVSATQITAVSPAGTQGSMLDITVTTPVGTSSTSSSDLYLYEGAPSVTAISPNAGVLAGGTTVVITGTNFTETMGVSFGANFSSSVTVNSPTQITAIAPAGAEGTINVRVTTPVGTSVIVPAAQYTYEGVPTVTQVFPNAGLPAGSTSVQIAGTNFTDATAVYFGSTPATSFTVNSGVLITAVSPAGTQGNIVDITVTTPVGTSTTSSADLYAYEGYPTVTGISPNAGGITGAPA